AVLQQARQVRALERVARLAQRQAELEREAALLAAVRRGPERALDLVELDVARAPQDRHALPQVRELAQVARPRVPAQHVLRRDAVAAIGQAVALRDLLGEVREQRRDILAARA